MDPVVREILETQYGFRFVRRIGRGGFGEVWEAHSAQGVPCALKISLDPIDADSPVVKKELENLHLIKALAGHPHLVSLQDFWQIEGTDGPYLITRWELAPDENARSLEDLLRHYREQGQPGIALKELLRHMADAAQGIDFLNGQGIIHRDIKPANLLLFFGRVKVGDLGLAKFVGASSASHTGVGTLGYLPPEAYAPHDHQKGRLTGSVDLYGLAASYVKLRTGREPFGESPQEIVRRQAKGQPVLEGLTEAEKPLVLAALQPDPDTRFNRGATAWVRELYQALRKASAPAQPSTCVMTQISTNGSSPSESSNVPSAALARTDPTPTDSDTVEEEGLLRGILAGAIECTIFLAISSVIGFRISIPDSNGIEAPLYRVFLGLLLVGGHVWPLMRPRIRAVLKPDKRSDHLVRNIVFVMGCAIFLAVHFLMLVPGHPIGEALVGALALAFLGGLLASYVSHLADKAE